MSEIEHLDQALFRFFSQLSTRTHEVNWSSLKWKRWSPGSFRAGREEGEVLHLWTIVVFAGLEDGPCVGKQKEKTRKCCKKAQSISVWPRTLGSSEQAAAEEAGLFLRL